MMSESRLPSVSRTAVKTIYAASTTLLLGLAPWLAFTNACFAYEQPKENPRFAKVPKNSVESVNPFVGTAGHGHTYPGATVPFGMVQLSPDTGTEGWDWCSGYHYSDDTMLGFSHTHLSGTGCGDLGDILLAPTIGKVYLSPGKKENIEQSYRSKFSHANEKASPGYYSVLLSNSNIKAELTATRRTGFHRYTFPASDSANVVIDLAHGISDKPVECELNFTGETRFNGMRRSSGWAKDQHVYFAGEFSKPFKSFGTAVADGAPQEKNRHTKGDRVKGWASFDTKEKQPILVKVGISTVSIEGAERNLQQEANGWDFDIIKSQAVELWKQELDKVQVEGVAVPERETFYTALYHTLMAPTLISDVDGKYRGSDQQVHEAGPRGRIFSTFSLWDTFRAEQPLFTVLQNPHLISAMLSSFLAQAEQWHEHCLPIWPLYANETYCMIGYHSFPVIAEAHAKKITSELYPKLYDHMVQDEKRNDWWSEKGYMASDKEGESVSKTVEFSYDNWCLAQLALSLGKKADYEKYLKRSESFKNLYDKETGFLRGRLEDGSWRSPFDPADTGAPDKPKDFTEGNSWQYSFFAPHDVQGLINLAGGRSAFVKKLDELFNHDTHSSEAKLQDFTGVIGEYAHGNEPSHHIAYLYSYAGVPAKTQERLHKIITTLYNNKPDGLCGNEDCGQMSAWYVFSALGFYPVNPAQATYVIGAPAFESASLTLPNAKVFTVKTKNFSPENIYVDKVKLNGRPLDHVYLTHTEIMDGGTLEFTMSNKPGSWGTGDSCIAPSSVSEDPEHHTKQSK